MFKRLKISDWRQFSNVDISFHPHLTVLTGANGAGKTTILNLLSQSTGWDPQFVSSYEKDKAGISKYFNSLKNIGKRFFIKASNTPNAVENKLGELEFSDGTIADLILPQNVSSGTYSITTKGGKKEKGVYISSHRPSFPYRAVKTIPTSVATREQIFKKYDDFNRKFVFDTYRDSDKLSATALIKETIASLAIFGYGNQSVVANENAKKLFEGYADILKIVLPPKLGFEGISVIVPEVTIGALSDISKIEKVGFKTVLAPGYSVHVIDEQVEARMREFLDVAPAHNGPYLEAVSHFRKLLPDAVLVGAFETAFHETIPLERKIYAVPYEWYEKYGFQRMGYHGASHSYVSETIELKFGSTDKMISCHLGGSCSLCAIDEGKSVDTTFGLSLQNGICHANRCGDLDVYVFPFLNNRGYSNAEILQGLEKEGGLLGISGVSNDMRELREAAASGNERAQLAINHFVNGIVKYIGAFYAELGGLDNLVFTGGIGENDDALRTAVCQQLAHLGVELADNSEVDADGTRVISAANSRVRVVVIPANEELGVARKTYQAIS